MSSMTATVLSIVAIVTSLGSLGWQMLTWRASGHVVKVEANDLPMIVVRNKGRSPVTVNSVKLLVSRQQWVILSPDGGPGGPGLPYRLEPGSDVRWTPDIKHGGWKIAIIGLADGKD